MITKHNVKQQAKQRILAVPFFFSFFFTFTIPINNLVHHSLWIDSRSLYSIFHNPSALPHALTLLTTRMGRGEFIDKNAH